MFLAGLRGALFFFRSKAVAGQEQPSDVTTHSKCQRIAQVA